MDLHTGTSLWVAQAGLPASYPTLTADLDVDVAIVGAGVTGAAIAHELSRAGLHVVVVDKRDVATGSSAASTGLLLYEPDSSLAELAGHVGEAGAARVYQLGIEAIDAIEDFCRRPSASCGFARRPSLYLASRRGHVKQLREEYERRVALGHDVRWLDGTDVKREYGFAAPAALRTSATAQVDCYRLTHALLAAARSAGAVICDRTTAHFPELRRGRWTVTTDRGSSIAATWVIWATGYEAGRLAPSKVQLSSTWVIATEPIADLSSWPDRCLIWETDRPYLYVRSTDDGRLVVGGEDEECAECHRSARAFRRKTTRLLSRAQGLFPSFPLEVAYAWAGTFSRAEDGLPVIGELAGRPGIWLAIGYGGNGITFGLIAARLIADALAGRANADLALFSA